jgi:hypothetical protein
MVRIVGLLLGAVSTSVGTSVIAESVMVRIAGERRAESSCLNIWKEMRAFLWVAIAVFAISVFAQLLFIRMMHTSFADFFSQPRRTEMFLMTTCINLVNGFIAGYLALRAKHRERRWRVRHQEVTGYLNHHVRNALCSIQYVASSTENEKVVQTCNDSVRRIVEALVTAEKGIPQDDEFRQFQRRLKVS